MSASRQLTLPGLHNLRDLGGLPLNCGGQTRPGAVLRGCDLSELTPAGRRALQASGVTSLIDLRSTRERAQTGAVLSGLPSRHVPLFDRLEPAYKMVNSSRGFSLTARYLAALERAGPRFAEAFAALAEAPPGLVLVHCSVGKDRTGLVCALLLELAGAAPATILADYALSATAARPYLERLARRSRARKTPPHLIAAMLDAPPAALAATLDHLRDHHGGAAAYLAAAGLAPDHLQRAPARLIAKHPQAPI